MTSHRQLTTSSRRGRAAPGASPALEPGAAGAGEARAAMTCGPSRQRGALSGPVRTCTGCRGRDAKQHLVRIAVARGRPIVDLRQRQPGRGAYVHPRPECVDRALARGNIGRALRTPVDPSHTSALRQSLASMIESCAPGGPSPGGERPVHEGPPQTPAEPRTCSNESPQRTKPSTSAERMSRTTTEISSANSSTVPGDRGMNGLTRPAPPFVDETRQARGQR